MIKETRELSSARHTGRPESGHRHAWKGIRTGMRQALRFLLVAALLFVAPAAMAFDVGALQKLLQKEEQVQGQFSQARYLRGLPDPLRSSGDFNIVPGQSLLWHVRSPFEYKVRMDAEGLEHWADGRWQRDRQTGTGDRAQLAFFRDIIGGRFESLSQHFSMQLSGDEKRWQLHLTPSSVLMKQIFATIDITGDAYVRTVKIAEAQGDRMELEFSALSHGQ